MSKPYDYHKPHRSHAYYESRRKRLIFFMLLFGSMIIGALLYFTLQ